MNEVKKPKKPLIYYYSIVLLVLLLLNVIVMPAIRQLQIKEVDYGTFMTMINQKQVGKVEVQDNRILFTDKEEKNIYKTGKMDDPGLTERLYLSGAQFSSEIVEQMSPILSFLLSWILPIAVFFILGQLISKKLTEKMTGGNSSMMFNLGKSNAKVYVKSSDGIKFSDVAGEDEAKENLAEIVDYLHNPQKYTSIGASMPKGVLLVGPP
ncbi:MAG: ATP-dependent metallopeptidase FtsH/Yme1/Tma family protein, partial [Clostridia bacterium]|nr:ATP-dependent metallopeptidase FtsH/Yme1/Tma family protein [Clostridia bacterium]